MMVAMAYRKFDLSNGLDLVWRSFWTSRMDSIDTKNADREVNTVVRWHVDTAPCEPYFLRALWL